MAMFRCGGGADVSAVTAVASDVLPGKVIVNADGEPVIGTMATKGAQIYTPGASDQAILSGRYLKGNQTIKGDPNLIASNIRNGVQIFGVTGNRNVFAQRYERYSIVGTGRTQGVDYERDGGGNADNINSIVLENLGFHPTHASIWMWNAGSQRTRINSSYGSLWVLNEGALVYNLESTMGSNPSKFNINKITLPVPDSFSALGDYVYFIISGYYP